MQLSEWQRLLLHVIHCHACLLASSITKGLDRKYCLAEGTKNIFQELANSMQRINAIYSPSNLHSRFPSGFSDRIKRLWLPHSLDTATTLTFRHSIVPALRWSSRVDKVGVSSRQKLGARVSELTETAVHHFDRPLTSKLCRYSTLWQPLSASWYV